MTPADSFEAPTLSDVATVSDALALALEGRTLLIHPFYQRWEAGLVSQDELAEYAVHYRAFEAALPGLLSITVDQLQADGEVEAEEMVRRNLDDELGRPRPHLDLFDRFAAGLSGEAVSSRPGPAATALVGTYAELASAGPVPLLAGLAAYESQASAIASTKGEGLRRHYGMDAADTEFWDVHAAMDREHAGWAVEALLLLGAEPSEVAASARRAADAWWAFLDERESRSSAPAVCSR